MANTGNILPGTGENNAATGGTGWTGPTNIVSDNATDATCNAAASSQYLVARNFGFTLPAGAVIGGVLVRVEASEHSGGTEPLLAQLQDASGALIGNEKTTSNEGSISGTTKAVYTYGSTSDVWGATLTQAIVNDADFGVRFRFNSAHDVRVDFVTIAIEYTVPTVVLPGTGAATLAGFAPTPSVTNNVVVAVGVGVLSFAGFSPSVAVTAHQNITPGTGVGTLSGFSPTVQTPRNVLPGLGQLTFNGFSPTVAASAGAGASPGTGQLAFTGFSPTVNVTDHKNILPGLGQGSFTGFSPSVVTSDHKIVLPGVGDGLFTGYIPTVIASDHKIVTPGTGELLFNGFSPSVSGGSGGAAEILPGTGIMIVTGFAPHVVAAFKFDSTIELSRSMGGKIHNSLPVDSLITNEVERSS